MLALLLAVAPSLAPLLPRKAVSKPASCFHAQLASLFFPLFSSPLPLFSPLPIPFFHLARRSPHGARRMHTHLCCTDAFFPRFLTSRPPASLSIAAAPPRALRCPAPGLPAAAGAAFHYRFWRLCHGARHPNHLSPIVVTSCVTSAHLYALTVSERLPAFTLCTESSKGARPKRGRPAADRSHEARLAEGRESRTSSAPVVLPQAPLGPAWCRRCMVLHNQGQHVLLASVLSFLRQQAGTEASGMAVRGSGRMCLAGQGQ